jgi:hypothetical protein
VEEVWKVTSLLVSTSFQEKQKKAKATPMPDNVYKAGEGLQASPIGSNGWKKTEFKPRSALSRIGKCARKALKERRKESESDEISQLDEVVSEHYRQYSRPEEWYQYTR